MTQSLRRPRPCQCGCGAILTGRANRKYVNASHQKRVQRSKIKPWTSGVHESPSTHEANSSMVSNSALSMDTGIRGLDPTVVAKRAIFELTKQQRWDDLSDLHTWLMKTAAPGYRPPGPRAA